MKVTGDIRLYTVAEYAKLKNKDCRTINNLADVGVLESTPPEYEGRRLIIERISPNEINLEKANKDLEAVKQLIVNLCSHLGAELK